MHISYLVIGLLDLGTPEQSRPTTTSMCGPGPKTQWTGAWRLPLPPQASSSSWRTRGCRARPLSAANRCRVKKSAKCQTSICTLGRSLRRAWREVCRWITYTVAILVRKQFILGAKSLPYGAPGNSTPLASYCVETVRNSVRVTQKLELSVSARPSVAKNDEHREGV